MDTHIIWACLLVICTTYSFVECKTAYSEKELSALERFRQLVPDITGEDEFYNTDNFLIRWLRARKLDVDAAHKMIRETFKWRKENQIDSIVDEVVYNFPTAPYIFEGFDKEGRPIGLITPTHIPLRNLILAGKRKVAIRLFDQALERGLNELRKLQNTTLMSKEEPVVDQFTVILDMTGFNRMQHICLQCISVYIDWFSHLENHYPGYIRHLVAINVNRIALPVVEIVKPFMSETTRNGLKVFGPNKQEWSSYLLSIADADQLPYRFGGTAKN